MSITLDRPATRKPRLRGWLHFGAAPLSFVLALSLLTITPMLPERVAVAIYAFTTVMLFSVSASYHLGAGGPRVNAFLNRLDHANIYLFIAGSYTPFAVALGGPLAWLVLALVWTIALVAMITRVSWRSAPRWLAVGSYIGLGWVAVLLLPAIWSTFGPGVVALMAVGGLLYTAGGVVYARKAPNFHHGWFGFHELFHALTISAFLFQFTGIAVAVTQGQ
ncbi:MAG TPA: hemolysin III family protein [Actinomycetota bacterium]|nr:hemolysin III family protein [Actinomycetota bacterium]